MTQTYDPKAIEKKWQDYWEKHKIYSFNPKKKNVYSIDTPPPYASADHLHVGHGMHYSQFEFIARYQRMRGKNVFFPMGYDDNGLPTERYVEKKYNLNKSKISRKEFIKLCLTETKKAGQNYYSLFTRLGFSIDWNLLYQTIGEEAQRVAQLSFLELYKQGKLERTDQPTIWCTSCQTTIAQADLENIDSTSAFHHILFRSKGKELVIATTRPELIPACVALFYHPEDKRYRNLKGAFATVPLFKYEVPLLADESVDPEKGTGLMMVCTWGDKEDIEKWHKHRLETRVIFTENGLLNALAGPFQGMKLKDARRAIVETLQREKLHLSEQSLTHAVNTHERCGTPIEFLRKKQWQISVLDQKEELIARGKEIQWYPDHMRVRYEHWVKNLHWEWNISRQRYYGVPFPVWYCQDCHTVLLASEKHLPVDPRETSYHGACTCGSKKIAPELDVMDTWMTSSNTPEINAHWKSSKELPHFLPMSLRPQAHDILRTWLFYTLVKAHYLHDSIPWKHVMISGHGLDPHGQKMSKSKNNFIVAQDIIAKYSADAFRYWSATGTLGEDLTFQEKDVVTGQKTVTKLWNASKFVYSHLADYAHKKPKKLAIIDHWLLSKLQTLIAEATEAFDHYAFSHVKNAVDHFFWNTFCDHYLEIVKDRLYNPDKREKEEKHSAQYTLYVSLQTILKLFAPIMPFVTEEIYAQYYFTKEKTKSIHLSSWPDAKDISPSKDALVVGEKFVAILTEVRQFKSKEKVSLAKECVLTLEKKDYALLKPVFADLKAVTKAKEIKEGNFGVSL